MKYNDKNRNRSYADQQQMPHDIDTERSVLATFVRYNETFVDNSDTVDAELFYLDKEKALFRTIAAVIDAGLVADAKALCHWAKTHDMGMELTMLDFLELIQQPSRLTLSQDIARLHDMKRRRGCWLLLQQAAHNVLDMSVALNDTLEGMNTALGAFLDETFNDGVATFRDAVDELRTIVEENAKGNTEALETGYYTFDHRHLLRPGTLTVIAAFTSVGKSALAMNIATNVAEKGHAVAYYSLEMNKTELASRTLADKAQMPAAYILNNRLYGSKLDNFNRAAVAMEHLNIYIDERSTLSFDHTIRSIRRLTKSKDVKLTIIDYLQIYSQTGDNVEASLAQMARQAKNIAKETNTAVILLSQLNRSAQKPSINMLRGSGQIEESADNVVLIDRPKAYERTDSWTLQEARFIVAKGRGTGTGEDEVNFKPVTTRFIDKYHPELDETPF